MSERGVLLTFEGPEGSGKSIQIRGLADFLRDRGLPVVSTKEPGGTEIGDQIRGTLTAMDNTSMHPRTEVLLFQASRAQLTEQVLKPQLDAGTWVLLDRFFDSTLAYQGYGHGIEMAKLLGMIDFATDGLKPDLTLLLDVDIETGLRRKRRQEEWNRLDAMSVEFHNRVRNGYLDLAAQEPERWRIIDASRSIEEVQTQIQETVTNYFGLKSVGLLGTV